MLKQTDCGLRVTAINVSLVLLFRQGNVCRMIGGEKNSDTSSGSFTISRKKDMSQNQVHIMVKTNRPSHSTHNNSPFKSLTLFSFNCTFGQEWLLKHLLQICDWGYQWFTMHFSFESWSYFIPSFYLSFSFSKIKAFVFLTKQKWT